jgi:hypothetical protein
MPCSCAYRHDMIQCNTRPLRNAPRRLKREAVKLYGNGELEGVRAAVWQ